MSWVCCTNSGWSPRWKAHEAEWAARETSAPVDKRSRLVYALYRSMRAWLSKEGSYALSGL
jgi:hypothetical protein